MSRRTTSKDILATIKRLGEHIDSHMEKGEYFAALAVAHQQGRTIKELIKRKTSEGGQTP